ncbi:ROK family protein [Deinococcus sp. KSM4-11]|uniref:ROK family protein n=1 Tax=Deinococcus sp. KSM4-11 TaxID=2568654 RepID=UPI0010A3F57D|nr:ROK family protein [Deinococcus sp. KSM4-11]THF85302.1 ROK family protein [Deinococcus sp. KSM4-11]
MSIIGLDLGGTKLAAGVLDGQRIAGRVQYATPAESGGVVPCLAQAARDAAQAAGTAVGAVGLGVPGPVNYAAGEVRFAGNIRGWIDYPVRRLLSEALDCPVYLENDANAATLAEHRSGAGQGADSTLYVTVSTGIGGGFVQGDRVLRGHFGQGAEIGHVTVLAGGPMCACGLDGCLEAVASGSALASLARGAFGQPMSNAALFDLARQGDERAARILTQGAEWLGIGLASLVRCYDPEVIVIGGGVYLNAPPLYHDAVQRAFERYTSWHAPEIRTARLGGDAGLLGAAYTAQLGLQQDGEASIRTH